MQKQELRLSLWMQTSKNLDHLGLISGMIDELGLVDSLNGLLQTDGIERDVSLGILCKSLIINGLGFTQRTLYMVSSFFSDKPVEALLGPGIEASQLNDTVLGRCLDVIYERGCTALYASLVPQICRHLGLSTKFAHMDSTDFHVDGVYNSQEDPSSLEDAKVIHLTQGYSRDHRPDLNQVVLNLIVENQAGIPLHMQALDGNTSDRTAFHDTVKVHVGQLQNVVGFDYLVMDSAGYTTATLLACQGLSLWISRVPETLLESKLVVGAEYGTWLSLKEGYRYVPLRSTYAGIGQRWLLVFSQEAYVRELNTLKKNFAKGSEQECKAFLRLCNVAYGDAGTASKDLEKFIKGCKFISVNRLGMKEMPVFDKRGRPSKNAVPVSTAYYIQGAAYTDRAAFDGMARKKGRFIIATNEMDEAKLSDIELLEGYKGQSKVERGFRFLKDPQFLASTMFVKKPERVEALLFIMTLSLTVYAALEYRIRQELQRQETTLPNQLGKQVKNPTTRWVFQLFNGIHVLLGQEKTSVLNLKPVTIKIINLLGYNYQKYYLMI
jgi:transposase